VVKKFDSRGYNRERNETDGLVCSQKEKRNKGLGGILFQPGVRSLFTTGSGTCSNRRVYSD